MDNIAKINQVLTLIEEWTYQLENEQLPEKCRKSGMNFFSFMQSRGVNSGLLAKLIIDATGYNPRTLWTKADAKLLRDAIFRYEASIATTKIDEEYGIERSAEANARRFWT